MNPYRYQTWDKMKWNDGLYGTFVLKEGKQQWNESAKHVPVLDRSSAEQEHHSDVIMDTFASQITGVSTVCSTVSSGTDRRKHQSSASLAFVRGIHQWPVDSLHKGQITPKMFPFDDVITLKTGLMASSWPGRPAKHATSNTLNWWWPSLLTNTCHQASVGIC